jgi:cyanate permease
MVALGFLVYGLGMAPAYYGWGLLAPEVVADLGLSRAQVGNVFGLFTLTFAIVSPLAAVALQRFGLRPVVSAGSLLAALGFWQTSGAGSATEFVVVFSLLGGIGVGFSSLLPAQVLPVFWFRRYRARATAVILLGAGVVGALVPALVEWVLQTHDWRTVWKCVAGVSVGVALLAALFLRDRPEDVGQHPDGDALGAPPRGGSEQDEPARTLREGDDLSTAQAIFTPQFVVVTFACLTNAVPWRVFTAHGRLHFEDLGFASAVAAAILGVRVGVSALGRLGGAAGDFIDPRRVLASALAITAAGMAGLAVTTSSGSAYVCIVLLGFGYGVGFTNEPLVFARMFGTRAFIGSNGLRIAITGVFGWLGPTWAGAAADLTGSYASSFVALAALSLVGAAAILLCRTPKSARER